MTCRFVLVVTIFISLNYSVLWADYDKQQSCKAAASRFRLNKGEAFDKVTKLTWSRCSVGATWNDGSGCVGSPKLMSLEEAKHFARQAGNGWRLPTIKELYSLVERGCENPVTNSIVFPDIKNLSEGAPYWSDTRVEEMPMLIYYVDFMSGRIDGHSEEFIMAVRLVRDPK